MDGNQFKKVQIFIILFFSSLTLYVLFKELKKGQKNLSASISAPKKPIIKIKSKEPKNVPENSASKDKIAPEPPKKVRSRTSLSKEKREVLDQFRNQAEDILTSLPSKQDLQQLEDGQVHKIPAQLLDTGRALGRLKEQVIRYPEFKELQEEAKTYYKNCADEDEFPTSIRSLCLVNRIQLAKDSGEVFDIAPYPLEIKQLIIELGPFK
jgi:hypothetical protein